MTEAAAEDRAGVADEVVDAAAPPLPAPLDPLKKIAAGIEALKAEAARVAALDLATTAGDKAQRQLRQRCVELRTLIDGAYETMNRPLLDLQRQARTLVADIKKAITEVEAPAEAAIKAREEKKAAEKKAREEAEDARLKKHSRAIDAIRAVPLQHARSTAAQLDEAILAVSALDTGEATFEEFGPAARGAQEDALQALRDLRAAAGEREAEAARLAAEREAMERRARFEQRQRRIAGVPAAVAHRGTADIDRALEQLRGLDFSDWGDYAQAGLAERAAAVEQLLAARAAAAGREAEAARLEQQRQEQEAERQRLADQAAELARLQKRAEDADVAGILAAADRVEGESVAYIEKAIGQFATVERLWANDTRLRVAAAVVQGRESLQARLDAAREREAADLRGAADHIEKVLQEDLAPMAGLPADLIVDAIDMMPAALPVEAAPAVAPSAVEVSEPVVAPETPCIRLASICEAIGPGLTMTRAFVSTVLGVPCYEGERGAIAVTPSGRRQLLAALQQRIGAIL